MLRCLQTQSARLSGAVVLVGLVVGAPAQSLFSDTVATTLTQPLAFVQDPQRGNVQYIVEQGGLIKISVDGSVLPAPFLDLSASVLVGTEAGLLGMAWPSPNAFSPYFYVNFTTPGPTMQVARFTRNPLNPNLADLGSRLDVIRTVRPQASHLSGTMMFGPDGMLYIPMGDGGGNGDPPNNSQNPNTLLGKMVRIDPRSDDFPLDPDRNYHVPIDNPFVDNLPISALHEIWSFGLRNVFKFSFDDPSLLGNGALIMGDVGQNAWEELDYEPAGQGGNNYGWRRYEGFAQFSNTPLAYGPATKPIYVYDHSIGSTVIGGRVYRGFELGPDFFGRYFFGEFSLGKLWSMVIKYDSVAKKWRGYDLRNHTAEIGNFGIGNIASIDIDGDGELYLVNYGGWVSKVHRTNTTWITGFTLEAGKFDSGSLRHLVAYDGMPLQLETQVLGDTDVVTTISATTTKAGPTTLDFDAVGNNNPNATGLLRLLLHRWSDNQFVQVRAEYLNSTKRRFRVTGLNAAGFVRPGDGRVELRLSARRTSAQNVPYIVSWDQVTLSAK